jgi:flagellar biosynthesis/type III secretory pathway M-ring protein FliF/YscJ
MGTPAHHLTAVYLLAASILVPLVIVGFWRYLVKRQHRKAEEAMRRGNQLHRKWLEASKLIDERSTGQ